MSAVSTLVFYGVRFSVGEDEIESLETRSHPLLLKARQNRLNSYWGDFGMGESHYLLFIGDLWASSGIEGNTELEIALNEAVKRATDTNVAIERAGIDGSPMLHIAFQPDR